MDPHGVLLVSKIRHCGPMDGVLRLKLETGGGHLEIIQDMVR